MINGGGGHALGGALSSSVLAKIESGYDAVVNGHGL